MRITKHDDQGTLVSYQLKAEGVSLQNYPFDDADFQLTILPDPKEQVQGTPNGRPTIEWLISLKLAEELVAGLSEGIELVRNRNDLLQKP